MLESTWKSSVKGLDFPCTFLVLMDKISSSNTLPLLNSNIIYDK